MSADLSVRDLGRAPYAETLALQKRLLGEVRDAEEERAHLLLVEHDPPVVTFGTSGAEANLLADEAQLAREGIEIHRIRRGGDVTYHGPGQLVAYPILRVDLHGRDVHAYLRSLEQVVIRTLEQLGISARRVEGLTGVWVGEQNPRKVAAIGVGVKRWVSYHGLALNVQPNMRHFGLIVPCGIADRPVTSVAELLGTEVSVSRVKPILVNSLAEEFGFDLRWEKDAS
ncbi:MAG: lipoyl(octanoyl) transferase LipB [Planctomycetota bacterium]